MTRYAEGTTVQPEKPRERPILFSGAMVKAILAGTKTQTRRVVKFPKLSNTARIADARPGKSLFARQCVLEVPYGDPSDDPFERVYPPFELGGQLWVRETWRTEELASGRTLPGIDGIRFAADNAFVHIDDTRNAADAWVDAHENGVHGAKWRPSIFMRRWACRITLEVTEVRVERLDAISETDAKAEGVVPLQMDYGSALPRFEGLWDSINGKREGCAWAANPWVWVVAFRRVSP